jgi:hypothetical protein
MSLVYWLPLPLKVEHEGLINDMSPSHHYTWLKVLVKYFFLHSGEPVDCLVNTNTSLEQDIQVLCHSCGDASIPSNRCNASGWFLRFRFARIMRSTVTMTRNSDWLAIRLDRNILDQVVKYGTRPHSRGWIVLIDSQVDLQYTTISNQYFYFSLLSY